MMLDQSWVRINEVIDQDGKPQIPLLARNMRSNGGMIIGRIVRETKTFEAQSFRKGEFKSEGHCITFDEALMLLRTSIGG